MSLILVWAPRLPFLTPQLLHDTAPFPSPWLAPFLPWQGSSETFCAWSQNMGDSTWLCWSCLDQNAHERLYTVHEHMQGATNWHCIYRTEQEPLCYSPTNKTPQRHCCLSTSCSALQTFSIYTPALASTGTSLVKEHLQTPENYSHASQVRYSLSLSANICPVTLFLASWYGWEDPIQVSFASFQGKRKTSGPNNKIADKNCSGFGQFAASSLAVSRFAMLLAVM